MVTKAELVAVSKKEKLPLGAGPERSDPYGS